MLSKQLQIEAKYFADRLLAGLLLVALAPFMLLVALLIKLDSRGASLFKQTRVGLNGSLFEVYKFRTMVHNADQLLNSHGIPQTNRITRIGSLLRRASIDELPQLINILLGEMSFVGPRPGPEERHERYTNLQKQRCNMKPGITGLAQVSGRNTLPWSRRVELDLKYIETYNWLLDLRILTRTVRAVICGDGIVLDRNTGQVDDIPAAPLRRIEPPMVGPYEKNASFEKTLAAINHTLAESHDRALSNFAEDYSTIHVIGVPRSGTTLLTQLIGSTLDLGYVNNLIAAFWRTPCYGIHLSQKLMPQSRPQSFESDYGRTSSIHEPHEFGYFWSHMLGYPEMAEQPAGFEETIDWGRLKHILVNMTHAFGKSAVFKSFLLAWHLRAMQAALPKSIFVWVRRDRVDNALSLARARVAQLGSMEKWLSIKPREYEWLQHENIATQLAGQIVFTEQAISRQVDLISRRNVLEITYGELCENPQGVVDGVAELLKANGQKVQRLNSAPPKFTFSRSTDIDLSLKEQIVAAFERFDRESTPVDMKHSRAA